MSELLPCPFCSGEARIAEGLGENNGKGFIVFCPDCWVNQSYTGQTKAEAVEAWNKRYEPTWGDFTKVAKGVKVAYLDAPERTTTATYDHRGLWTCGACGHFRLTDFPDDMHYCPNCGARVRSEE